MSTTLLAIDDSVTMRKVLEITFAGDDFNTVLASSGQEALQALSSHRPGIALVDHTLGDTNGYDLCQRIKSVAPSTRVILLSSKQHPYDKARGQAAGVDDFMDKPFDTQKLLDKVSAIMSQAPSAVSAGAAAAAKPASSPMAAAPAAAPARPRSQTLAYGSTAPATQAQAAPPVPRGRAVPPGPSPGAASPRPQPVAAAPSPQPARGVQAAAEAATSGNGQLATKLQDIGLSADQVNAVLALSREVVEQVVWEVVPVLAETIIREEIRRLTSQ